MLDWEGRKTNIRGEEEGKKDSKCALFDRSTRVKVSFWRKKN